MAEDEETKMWFRRDLRPFRHPNHLRLTLGKGKNAMLADLLDRYGYVSAQSETSSRLAVCAQIERL